MQASAAIPYRVLSLDGGGTWAVIQIKTLIKLFGANVSGHQVLAKFDLAVANSGGSVILACLALDKPLCDILDLYLDGKKRRSTFESTAFERVIEDLGHGKLPYPRYSTKKKLAGLREHLGPRSEATLLSRWHAENPGLGHLVITAFDYDTERAAFFRTNVDSLAASEPRSAGPDVSLLDAVQASTTAPVVFYDEPAHAKIYPQGVARRYWDGAFAGYNNPAMVAVVEALAQRQADHAGGGSPNVPREALPPPIRILSIGTGTVHRPRKPSKVPADDPRFMGGGKAGLLRDLQKATAAIVDDPPDSASFLAHVTLGGALPRGSAVVSDGPIVRMSPVVRPLFDGQDWAWPRGLGDPAALEVQQKWAQLTNLGLDALADDEMKLLIALCDAWHADGAPNQPIRARDDTLDAEVGDDNFSSAERSARELLGCTQRHLRAAEAGSIESGDDVGIRLHDARSSETELGRKHPVGNGKIRAD
jgi:patatin-like phospholipase